jgi:hypothetical protein
LLATLGCGIQRRWRFASPEIADNDVGAFQIAERKPHILPRRLAIDKSRAFARGRIWGR